MKKDKILNKKNIIEKKIINNSNNWNFNLIIKNNNLIASLFSVILFFYNKDKILCFLNK